MCQTGEEINMCNSKQNFVHLHNHTWYSVQDALPSPTDLAMTARKEGFPAVAITDHGRMGGCIEFFEACNKPIDGLDPIKPILGCEMYVVPDRFDKDMVVDEYGNKRRRKTWHLTMLAKNQTGYRNLLALSRLGAEQDAYHYFPRIDWDVITKHSEGVICLSGCLGSEVNQQLSREDVDGARETMRRYKEVFGEDYYGELQYHGIDLQKHNLPLLLDLCKELDIKTACSNDIHYLQKEQWELHDVLIHMRESLTKDSAEVKESGKREAYGSHEFYMKTEAQMRKMFGKVEECVDNTLEIADKVENFMKVNVPHMLPSAEIPTNDQMFNDFKSKHYPYHKPNEAYLAYLAITGLKALGLADNPVYKARLKYELTTVWNMGVTDYFLIQRELAEFMKQAHIRFGIRGSGVASLINYCLGISDIDPVRWNLMFERFLNPGRGTKYKLEFPEKPTKEWFDEHGKQPQQEACERIKTVAKQAIAEDAGLKPLQPQIQKEIWALEGQKLASYICDLADSGFKTDKNTPNLWSAYFLGITPEKPKGDMVVGQVATLPDVDTDIDDRYRDTAIEWARRRFGDEHVAIVGNWGTYAIKAAVTACLKSSKKFQQRYGEKSHIVAQSISKSIAVQPAHTEDPEEPLEFALKQNPDLQQYVKQFPDEFDAARKLIGVVSNLGVHASAVVIASEPINWHTPLERSNKGMVTAYDMNDVEKIGMVKYDFLGLAMHQKIERALKYIKERHGKEIDLRRIPMDDKKVLNLFNEKKTTTLFQFGSDGMKDSLSKVQVSDVEDLIAVVSLFRPGPLQFIPDYASYKRNPNTVRYPHEIIKRHLGVTYGIPVYQEQVMLVCRDMANFDHDEVDSMRKAVSKKNPIAFEKCCKLFKDKATKAGIDGKVVDMTLDSWKGFAGYAFNRAHAASYAILAYRGAYLRAYYPIEWLAACIQTDITGNKQDRVGDHIHECDSERPRIVVSGPDVNTSKLEVSITEKDVIVLPLTYIKGIGANGCEFMDGAPYEDIKDFIIRGEPSRTMLRNLAEAGALRSLPDYKGGDIDRFMERVEPHYAELDSIKREAKKAEKQRYTSMSPLQKTSTATVRPVRPAGKPFRPKSKPSILDSFE